MSHISVIKLPDNSTYDLKDNNAIAVSQKGAANGVVPLNASSQIDSAYLPSYVDDVIEGYYYNEKFWKESTHATEIAGEAGKIYINLETNPATTYRYTGSAFVQVGGGGSVITITRDLTSGTKSATINVNGTNFDIYSTNDTTYESKAAVSGGVDVSLVTTGDKYNWNQKQEALVSGTNIKTINNTSLLGSGNIEVQGSDTKVEQTATTTNADYEVLFSYTADNTNRTEGARKTNTLNFNPSTQSLTVGKSVKVNNWIWDGSVNGHFSLTYTT